MRQPKAIASAKAKPVTKITAFFGAEKAGSPPKKMARPAAALVENKKAKQQPYKAQSTGAVVGRKKEVKAVLAPKDATDRRTNSFAKGSRGKSLTIAITFQGETAASSRADEENDGWDDYERQHITATDMQIHARKRGQGGKARYSKSRGRR